MFAARLRGFTLLEILVVLALAAVLLGAALPLGRVASDRVHVVTAREELFGLVYRARGVATRTGGARIRIDLDAGRATLHSVRGELLESLELASRRVEISTTGSASRVDLRWNALGWGVLASRTLTLRRGAAEARLVVSSRGRASRR